MTAGCPPASTVASRATRCSLINLYSQSVMTLSATIGIDAASSGGGQSNSVRARDPCVLPGYLKELLHSGADVVNRLDTRRELNVEHYLRSAEFSRFGHVAGNLFQRAGEVSSVLIDRRLRKLDVGPDDELQRSRVAAGFLRHSLDPLEHPGDGCERHADREPAIRLLRDTLHGRRRIRRHIDRRMRLLNRLRSNERFWDPIILTLKLHRICRPDCLQRGDYLVGALASFFP